MALKPSKDAELFIESTYGTLGAENKAILVRSAICLGLSNEIPSAFKLSAAHGKDISTDAIYGDIQPAIDAAIDFKAGRRLTESERNQEIRKYFEWGCHQMIKIWEDEASRDPIKFVSLLVKKSTVDGAQVASGDVHAPIDVPASVVEKEVLIRIIKDATPWSLNGPSTSNGLMIVSGAPGSGKSQLVLDMLVQLSKQGCRFMFFDLKGELEPDPTNERQTQNRKKFFDQTGAKYTQLIQGGCLPINPLWREERGAVNAQTAGEIASIFSAFIPQLGPNQMADLNEAYQQLQTPDFESWLQRIEEMESDGVHANTLKAICDYDLFASAGDAVPLDNWLSTSHVIDFKQFGNDDRHKSLAVALILNLLIKKLNKQLASKNGVQPLKMVLFVDEAHLLLPKEGKSGLLGSLARQGRSWGFPVWLASQDADAFETSGERAVNFAELASCGVHLSPGNLSPAQQKQILGKHITTQVNKGEGVLRVGGKTTVGPIRQYHRDGGETK